MAELFFNEKEHGRTTNLAWFVRVSAKHAPRTNPWSRKHAHTARACMMKYYYHRPVKFILQAHCYINDISEAGHDT